MGVKVREKHKGSGEWWIFIDHRGSRKAMKIGRDKRLALRSAKIIEAELVLGKFNMNEKPAPLFKDYAKTWINTTVPINCKESTVRSYQDILRLHVLPVFGKVRITDIKRGKIKDFLTDKMLKGYAPNTVAHMKDVVSGVLTKALDDEVIQANPALRLNMKNPLKKVEEKINPLNQKELKELLDTVDENYTGLYPLVLTMARTGLRIGEALALRWEDVNFKDRFIHVRRGLVRGKITTPKNSKTRKVDMSQQLTAVLKQLLVNEGPKEVSEYIFTNAQGGLIDKDNWRSRVFYQAVEKAEIKRIRIHDLRHTYATLRIAKGDNIADVSNQLGHHSVKFTWDTYYHWVPGDKKDEVDGLDDPGFSQLSATYPQPTRKTGKKITAKSG